MAYRRYAHAVAFYQFAARPAPQNRTGGRRLASRNQARLDSGWVQFQADNGHRVKLQVLAEKYGELATTLIRRFRRHALDMQPGAVHRNEVARLRTATLVASAPETRQLLLALAKVHDELATADHRLLELRSAATGQRHMI